MKKILYLCLFMLIAFLLTGCFNKEKKANAIIDYFDEVQKLEGDAEETLGNYHSHVREATRSGDTFDMIELIEEDFIPVMEKQIDDIDNMDLTYRATKKIRDLHLDMLTEGISYYEWQLEVLYDEAPEDELEEIMKEEEDPFGLKTERDHSTHYMKGIEEIEKKKREFEKELDHYWDAYNIGDYMD